MQTVLATFDDSDAAQTAVDQLIAQGFSKASVHLQTGVSGSGAVGATSTGTMASIGHFFSNLFSSEDSSHAGQYSEAVRRGGTVVAVDAKNDAEIETAQTLMQKLGTVDVEGRAAEWKSRGWKGFDASAAPLSEDELAFERDSVPVVQEELVVGKRTVNVGGLRVIKRISETPVSQMINLRSEKATIERKPTNRPATEADFQNFKPSTVEIRETAEEAVVGKTARVVEEVSIGKTASEHSETVSDTVRRTDVDVERLEGDAEAIAQSAVTRKS